MIIDCDVCQERGINLVIRREAAYLFGQLDIQEISISLENNFASNLFFIRRSDKFTEESVSRKRNSISA